MIIRADNNYEALDQWLADKQKVLLVCDGSLRFLEGINNKLETLNTPMIRFSDFQPNPIYESVVEGVKLFRSEQCDSIMAIGGGSAIDVAKCIKMYLGFRGNGNNGSWLNEKTIPNTVPFLAMPTTAGTGSEATRYAVVYYKGIKQSITSDSIIPETVLMDPSVLETLPIYQKKATMCDALCHAVESYWSINSTDISKEYSRKAIHDIIENMDGYLANTKAGNSGMLKAAHIAGKAINITQTTAGHAMCYKITSLFGVAHGHAAIICDRVLFPWMIQNTDQCIDSRGEDYLRSIMDEIGIALGGKNAVAGAEKLNELFARLELEIPEATEIQYGELKNSVNTVRLKNNPIMLNNEMIDKLYHGALR